MLNKFQKDMYDFFDTIFPRISFCSDAYMLYDALEYDILKSINDILEAEGKNRIELIEPRFGDEPDLDREFTLVIHDESYIEKGIEKLILKWVNDYECTDYVIECCRE